MGVGWVLSIVITCTDDAGEELVFWQEVAVVAAAAFVASAVAVRFLLLLSGFCSCCQVSVVAAVAVRFLLLLSGFCCCCQVSVVAAVASPVSQLPPVIQAWIISRCPLTSCSAMTHVTSCHVKVKEYL